jgi:hypothetical protein
MEQWNSVKNPPETKVSHRNNCGKIDENSRKFMIFAKKKKNLGVVR